VAIYSVFIGRSAARELAGLPLIDRRRVVVRISGLSQDPRPPGCEKLSGQDKYRVRQGDIRVLYEIDDRESTVTVVKVAHRRVVYR
jgi:mRNA interferase RelE/StbE